MKILVLGGTGYIGPHLVNHALERGHEVTLFNRGRTRPGLFPKAEQLIGDRNAPGGHDALKGRQWDVVYDLPATNPQWVLGATAVLKGNAKQYVYVSSTAAYKDFTRSFPDERIPPRTLRRSRVRMRRARPTATRRCAASSSCRQPLAVARPLCGPV